MHNNSPRGTSDHAAIYAKYCFEIMTGIPVSLAAPSVVTLYDGKMDYRDTVVIGIKKSGMAEDVRLLIREAKKQGALTIACTNALSSPVANEAEFHLYCNAGKEKAVAATKDVLWRHLPYGVSLWRHLAGNEKLIQSLDGLSGGVQTLLKDADENSREDE